MRMMGQGTSGRAMRLVLALVAVLGLAVALAMRTNLFIPSWTAFRDGRWVVDLDGDGTDEAVELRRRCLSVDSATMQPYETPPSWKVMDAVICDVDGDGQKEVALLVWRRGNYGSSRPFWDTKVDLRMTEHLYVLCLREGQVEPFWMGHELGREVMSLSFDPASRQLTLNERSGPSSTWTWDHFSFVSTDK